MSQYACYVAHKSIHCARSRRFDQAGNSKPSSTYSNQTVPLLFAQNKNLVPNASASASGTGYSHLAISLTWHLMEVAATTVLISALLFIKLCARVYSHCQTCSHHVSQRGRLKLNDTGKRRQNRLSHTQKRMPSFHMLSTGQRFDEQNLLEAQYEPTQVQWFSSLPCTTTRAAIGKPGQSL